MKRIWIFAGLAFLPFLSAGGRADTAWLLGGRPVPGPLPPTASAARPDLDIQLDIPYGTTDDPHLKLDYAKPTLCRDQIVPLVVYVHGGSWNSGDKSIAFLMNDARMFFQLGFAVAAINYRLTPASKFPAQVNDGKLAIRYLRKNASTLGFDQDRIGIWGDSAGGHLVAMMGLAGPADGLEGPGLEGVSSRVKAVVEHYGPTDFTDTASVALIGAMSALIDFLGCDPRICLDVARAASPVSYVTSDDPPILCMHGDKDTTVPYRQAELLAARLKSVGNAAALIKVKNAEHIFVPSPVTAVISPSEEMIELLTVGHLARYLEPALFGDLNMDGHKDMRDLRLLLSLVGSIGVGPATTPAPDNWNPLADLVPDGVIDYKDVLAWVQSGRPKR
jgi:acetyl esterase/lipase